MIVQIKRGPGLPEYISHVSKDPVTGRRIPNDGDNLIIDGQLGFDTESEDLYIGQASGPTGGSVISIAGNNWFKESINTWLEGGDNREHTLSGILHQLEVERLENAAVGTPIWDRFFRTTNEAFVSWVDWGTKFAAFGTENFNKPTWIAYPAVTNSKVGSNFVPINISGLIDAVYARQSDMDDALESIDNQLTIEYLSGFLKDTFVRTSFYGAVDNPTNPVLNSITTDDRGVRIGTSRNADANRNAIQLGDDSIRIISRHRGTGTSLKTTELEANPSSIIIKGGDGNGNPALVIENGSLQLYGPGVETNDAVTFGQLSIVSTSTAGAHERLDDHRDKIRTLFDLSSQATFVPSRHQGGFDELLALPGHTQYNTSFYGPDPKDNSGFRYPDTDHTYDINRIENPAAARVVRHLGELESREWVSGIVKGKDLWNSYKVNLTQAGLNDSMDIYKVFEKYFENKETIVRRPRNGTQYVLSNFKGLKTIKTPFRFWLWDFSEFSIGSHTGNRTIPWTIGIFNSTITEYLEQFPAGSTRDTISNTITNQFNNFINNTDGPRYAEWQHADSYEHFTGRVWYNSSAAIDPMTGRPYYMDWQYIFDRFNVPDGITLRLNPDTDFIEVHPDIIINQGKWT
jgi:hypothetical protein